MFVYSCIFVYMRVFVMCIFVYLRVLEVGIGGVIRRVIGWCRCVSFYGRVSKVK